MSANLPNKGVDSLWRWCWWCEWCSCEWCFDECCTSFDVCCVVDAIESPGLIGRNRYDPRAFISFEFENTPFRPAVHKNTINKSSTMILNTANIDDNFCLDRVVIFSVIYYSLSLSLFLFSKGAIKKILCFTKFRDAFDVWCFEFAHPNIKIGSEISFGRFLYIYNERFFSFSSLKLLHYAQTNQWNGTLAVGCFDVSWSFSMW